MTTSSKVIAIVNQKGGVGKTATCCNLAYALSLADKKVLIIDMDPSRNASSPFCSSDEETITKSICDVLLHKEFNPTEAILPAYVVGKKINNLWVLPSRIQLALIQKTLSSKIHYEKLLKRQLEKLNGQFDYILIDCPPMLTELSILAIYAATDILIPVTYTGDALEGVTDLFETIKEVKENDYYDYKILRNGKDARKKTIIKIIESSLAELAEDNRVCKTVIRQDEEINKSKTEFQPIFTYNPKSIGAEDYKTLSLEIMNNE